jgi:putative transposase
MFGQLGCAVRAQVSAAGNCDGLFFSERLSPESVRSACEKLQHEFRERLFSPAVTLWVFLAQVLSGDHSCREAVAKLNFWRIARNLKPCSTYTGSYCEARQRLPEQLFLELVRSTGSELAQQAEDAWQWLGRVVKVVDGSTITMADTQANQQQYPQPRTQTAGVGFPIARIVVVFSLAIGVVVDAAIGPYKGKRTGENNLFRSLLECFLPGEIALADSYYASFWDFALLLEHQVDLVARVHHKRKIDFRTGAKLGRYDQVVTYVKPDQRPAWMDLVTYERLPASIQIRHLRYWVAQSGFRTRVITLATTLIDANFYTADELANLYRRRWQAELHLRSLKAHLQMDHLRSKQPATVRKEFYTHLLAYNLIRGIMLQAAVAAGASPHQLSFKGTLQSLGVFLGMVIADATHVERLYAALLWMTSTHRVGDRPDRIEPRLIKRRPKPHKLLQEPRSIARNRLLHTRCA